MFSVEISLLTEKVTLFQNDMEYANYDITLKTFCQTDEEEQIEVEKVNSVDVAGIGSQTKLGQIDFDNFLNLWDFVDNNGGIGYSYFDQYEEISRDETGITLRSERGRVIFININQMKVQRIFMNHTEDLYDIIEVGQE